jgi:3-oxoisoapionate kinase
MRLLSYYGDDFTGSTDVMEALASHGVATVLFTRIPTPSEFEPFAEAQAIGIAGSSRSQSPEWMKEHLPSVFAWLKTLQARFCHYKVCSTFDSSPTVGSIGCATDIGRDIFQQAMVPMIVGAPQLKRYTFAGHLFAAYQGDVYRIDRHPVMSRHPVTPMHESDLRLHLAQQTALKTVLANASWPESGIGLLDVHDSATQVQAGERLLSMPSHGLPFVVGSSGVEYALVKALTARKEIAGQAGFKPIEKRGQIIVASGSVSPTTERQIAYSLQRGFVAVPISAVQLARGEGMATAVEACRTILSNGQSPLMHTAMGTSTDVGEELAAIPDARKRIGEGLGQIVKSILQSAPLQRVVFAGGDTSSHGLSQLDVHALTTRFPLAATPGSPLCVMHSGSSALNGMELAMKGGQLGDDDYFVIMRDGL